MFLVAAQASTSLSCADGRVLVGEFELLVSEFFRSLIQLLNHLVFLFFQFLHRFIALLEDGADSF